MRTLRGVYAVGLTLTALLLLAATPGQVVVASNGGPPTADVPSLEELNYDVRIVGPYARTDVVALLKNPHTGKANHTFVFNVPRGALLSNFSLTVDGVTYYADVLEKQTAQEKYNAAVDEGRTAGLLSSLGDQLFTYGVSLSPGETAGVALRYEEILLKANGRFRYELGLTADPSPLKAKRMTLTADIASTTEVTDISTSGYNQSLVTRSTGPAGFCVNMGVSQFTPSEDVTIEWATTPGPLEGEMLFGQHGGMGYFVHIFGPDPLVVSDGLLPKDFVFVVDKSGSMEGRKLEQSKEALGLIYSSLDETDRFSLVKFDSTWEAFSSSLVKVTRSELDRLSSYVSDIRSSGRTDIHSAVMAALDIFKAAQEPVPIVVLLSDGQANTGLYARSDFRRDVLAKNTVDASIFCIALGSDADWPFLEAMALENHGRAIWVGEREDVATTIASFVRSFSSPMLSSLSFDYGPGVTDVTPANVRAHYAGSEVLVTGRFTLPSGPVTATMDSRGPDGSVRSEHVFVLPTVIEDDVVPRMWALHRIQSLEDQMKWNGTDNASVRVVIDLAMEFHLATDRTSMLVELPEELDGRFGVPAMGASSNGDGDGDAMMKFSSHSMGLTKTMDSSSSASTRSPSSGAIPASAPMPPSPEGAASMSETTLSVIWPMTMAAVILVTIGVVGLYRYTVKRGSGRSKGS